MHRLKTVTVLACCVTGLIILNGLAAEEAGTQTRKTDWCEITVPKSTRIGEKVEIRVVVTKLTGRGFICLDLKDQNHRMVKWGGRPRPIEQGKTTVYKLTVSDMPGIHKVYGYVFLKRRLEDS